MSYESRSEIWFIRMPVGFRAERHTAITSQHARRHRPKGTLLPSMSSCAWRRLHRSRRADNWHVAARDHKRRRPPGLPEAAFASILVDVRNQRLGVTSRFQNPRENPFFSAICFAHIPPTFAQTEPWVASDRRTICVSVWWSMAMTEWAIEYIARRQLATKSFALR